MKLINDIEYFDLKDASKRLGLTIATLRNKVYTGELSAYKIGNRIMFKKEQLQAYIDSCIFVPKSSKESISKEVIR